MPTGLSYEQHNRIILHIVAILEDGTRTPETRLEHALAYCATKGIVWETETEDHSPPHEGA